MSKPKPSPDIKLSGSNTRLVYEAGAAKAKPTPRIHKPIQIKPEEPSLQSMLSKIFKRGYLIEITAADGKLVIVISKKLIKYNEELYTISFTLRLGKLSNVKMINNFYKRYGKNHGTHKSVVHFLDSFDWKELTIK